MTRPLKKLLTHPLFLMGLSLKFALILLVQPAAPLTWYLPFLDNSAAHFSSDPWSSWLSLNGNPIAFPYGYAMWLCLFPVTFIFKTLGLPLLWSYGFSLCAADFALLLVLRKLLPNRDRLLLSVYWLSPIVLFASYGLGLNDLIPVLLLMLALYCTRELNMKWAGALCVAAISAKLSMIIALPFFLIYLFHNRAMRQLLPDFLKGLSIAAFVLILPFVFSKAGLFMLFNNPEMGKVYQFALPIGKSISLYLVPMVYLVMLYAAWRVRRINFELFQSIMGLSFLLVVLLTPASPGWFIWILPLLVFFQAGSSHMAIILSTVFSGLYVVNTLLSIPGISFLHGFLDTSAFLERFGQQTSSILHTAMTAIGIVLTMRIWRETISLNDYFRLSRKPFVIGIAGDSGAGKDTFSDALTGLFGQHSVATLAGDDYHLWDRHKPMWRAMTHLNPMANDLERFAHDLVALTDGKAIFKRHYDHGTGKMSRPTRIKSNDFIIANGLHALYLPMLRRCYNLSIYLDMDESLRRYFKMNRDVHVRGHSVDKVLSAFEKRGPDAEKFIRPQAGHADLLLSLKPIHPHMLDAADTTHPPRLRLVARSRNSLSETSLTRVLIGVCGLHVDMIAHNETGEVELSVEGETTSDDIAMAARMLCPRILEFVDIEPQWQDGVVGLMQLITLSHINQALTHRFI